MKRNYEGTTRLQGIGVCQGIKAKNLKVGDVLVWNFGGTSIVKEITFSKTGKTLTIIEECNGTDYDRRMTAERIVVVKELNPAPAVEEVEAEEIEEVEVVEIEALDVTGVNYYNMEELKDMVANWSELSQYVRIFIESASKFDFDGNELIIYMGRKAVASGMFYVKGGKIVITSIGAGELFQWEKGKAEEKEVQEMEEVETVKTVFVEGVEVEIEIIPELIEKVDFTTVTLDKSITYRIIDRMKRTAMDNLDLAKRNNPDHVRMNFYLAYIRYMATIKHLNSEDIGAMKVVKAVQIIKEDFKADVDAGHIKDLYEKGAELYGKAFIESIPEEIKKVVEEEKALINKSIIADAIKKEGFVVGCYDSRIEQLKKSQLKRIIEQALVLEWTDVIIIVNGVKCVVEISTVDNEKDFNLMTYKEYKNTYGDNK